MTKIIKTDHLDLRFMTPKSLKSPQAGLHQKAEDDGERAREKSDGHDDVSAGAPAPRPRPPGMH